MSVSYPLRQQWLGNIRGDLLSGTVVALERVVGRLRAHGAQVEVRGLNAASQTLVERLGRRGTDDASRPGEH